MEKRKLTILTPYDRNPRKNKEAIDRVLESLNRHGQVKPIVISAKGKPFEQEVIAAGHTTLQALKRFGAKEAFVVVKEFADEAQFIDYNIRDNKSGEYAEWDETMLASLGAEFDVDLDEMGFDIELDDEQEGETDEDEVPEAPEEPVAKVNQIWKLGEHRLMCGDSTDKATVEALMDGEKADMVFTDPPYLIQTEGGCKGNIGEGLKKQGQDIKFISNFSTENFLKTLPTVFDKNTFNAYIFCNKELLLDYLLFAKENKLSQNVLIWKKPNAIPIGGSHRPDIEYLILFRKNAHWNGGLKNVDYTRCLEFGRETGLHPTMKPIALIANEIEISAPNKGLVFDFFGGSGSTLIACEKTGRKCRMMEIDNRYIDVIIKRWEDYTGKKAELIKDAI